MVSKKKEVKCEKVSFFCLSTGVPRRSAGITYGGGGGGGTYVVIVEFM